MTIFISKYFYDMKSKKKTGKVQKQSEVTAEPRTVPLITMNPQTLPKGVKNDAEKLSRQVKMKHCIKYFMQSIHLFDGSA